MWADGARTRSAVGWYCRWRMRAGRGRSLEGTAIGVCGPANEDGVSRGRVCRRQETVSAGGLGASGCGLGLERVSRPS